LKFGAWYRELIRHELIPKAVRYYTGEIIPEDDGEESDEDEDDEEHDEVSSHSWVASLYTTGKLRWDLLTSP
jgi:hypothetical protein